MPIHVQVRIRNQFQTAYVFRFRFFFFRLTFIAESASIISPLHLFRLYYYAIFPVMQHTLFSRLHSRVATGCSLTAEMALIKRKRDAHAQVAEATAH